MATIRKNITLGDPTYFCNKSWTASYHVNAKAWISFHSYLPNFYIAENNFFYSGLNGCCDDIDFIVAEVNNNVIDCSLEGIAELMHCDLEGIAIENGGSSTTTTTTTIATICDGTILVHSAYGSVGTVNMQDACDYFTTPVSTYYSYASEGLSPGGVTIYTTLTDCVLSNPFTETVPLSTTVIQWLGIDKYAVQFGNADGSISNYVLCSESNIPFLAIQFDDINNADLLIAGNRNNVSDWNAFFDLPTFGNEFTSVEIRSTTVCLFGGSNITISTFLFGGSDYGNSIIRVIDTSGIVVQLDFAAFSNIVPTGCSSLKEVYFQGVTTIGDRAFESCISLYNVNFPNVITIGEAAFTECNNLVYLNNTGDNLTSIGISAFENAGSILIFNFPLVTTVGDRAFQSCSSLFSLDLRSVTNLGSTVGDDIVFNNILGNTISLYVPAAIMTCNLGAPDGDIQILQANNTVTVIVI